MQNFDNAMRRQVFSLPELMKNQYEDLEPKTRKVLTTPEIFSIQRIILTGCGDSYAAAIATKHAFEMLTNIPTEVVPAIELSRLYHTKQLGFAPLNPLVIAVSNSGSGARVSEAIQRVNKYGAFSLGITGNQQSELAIHAKRVLDLNIPAFEDAPGVRSYMVSVMALLLMAIRIGEVRGVSTMDVSMNMRYDMNRQADKLQDLLPEMDRQILSIASQWKDYPAFDFIGTGFDYASAWYGHAKIFEAAGRFAMHINSEEWMHLNFFMRDADKIGTIVFANTTNPAASRTKEMISYAKQLGRPMLVITDGDQDDFGLDTNYCKVPKTDYPISMPLTHFVPTALLAGYIAEMICEVSGRGCKGPWGFCKGGACVKNSEIIVK